MAVAVVYGNKVSGRRVPQRLAETKPGDVFEFQIQTAPFENEDCIITKLLTLEQSFPDLKVLYVETDPEGMVTLQITDAGPGQISIGGVISLIPHLFILIGIVVIGIILWQVMQTQPYLVWLLLLAGGAVMVYYFVGKGLASVATIRKRGRTIRMQEGSRAELDYYSEQRKGYEGTLRRVESELNRVGGDVKDIQKKKRKTQDDKAELAELQKRKTMLQREFDQYNRALNRLTGVEKQARTKS